MWYCVVLTGSATNEILVIQAIFVCWRVYRGIFFNTTRAQRIRPQKNKNPRYSAQDLREGSYAEYRGFYLIFPVLYTTLRFENKCIKTRIVEIAMGA